MLGSLQNKRIIVLGMGASGQSCARWLQAHRLPFIWLDSRQQPPGLAELRAEFPGIRFECGDWNEQLLCSAHLLVMSPGIPMSTPAINTAKIKGVEIVGDVELFSLLVDKPVIAVTGSNGKSTVVTFIGQLLQHVGINAVVAGNIGLPVLDALQQEADCYVLELSSFQLMNLHSMQGHTGCILNLSPDHLDWHGDMSDYTQAKQRIYNAAKYCVYNRDDMATRPMDGALTFSVGLSQAETELDFGITKNAIYFGKRKLIDLADLPYRESHNVFNLMTALACCHTLGANLDELLTGLHKLSGLAHRCETVREHNQVRWINDSKATNVGATVAALQSLLPQVKGDLWLIAGGDGKGADFSELATWLNRDNVNLITLGKDGAEIARLKDNATQVESLQAAVAHAANNCAQGDTVLLSPACASLDMFSNFAARGEAFKQLVEELV